MVGHAAVPRDADRPGHDVQADVVRAAAARRAGAAPEELVHRHERPGLRSVRPLPSGHDLADDLMPQGYGQRQAVPAAAHEAQVRSTHACGEHPEQDLPRSWLGERNVDQLGAARAGEAEGSNHLEEDTQILWAN